MLTVFSHSVAFVSDSLQLHGLPARHVCPRGFSRQEYWSRLPCPPPEDIPNPGIKPMSPPLQMYSLLSELLGNLKNTGVDSLSLLQGIFLTQESNQDLLNCRWILYQLSYQGSPIPLLGIYPEEIIIEKHTHISVFIAALFTIARIWKQPRYLLADKWIKNCGTCTQWSITGV